MVLVISAGRNHKIHSRKTRCWKDWFVYSCISLSVGLAFRFRVTELVRDSRSLLSGSMSCWSGIFYLPSYRTVTSEVKGEKKVFCPVRFWGQTRRDSFNSVFFELSALHPLTGITAFSVPCCHRLQLQIPRAYNFVLICRRYFTGLDLFCRLVSETFISLVEWAIQCEGIIQTFDKLRMFLSVKWTRKVLSRALRVCISFLSDLRLKT